MLLDFCMDEVHDPENTSTSVVIKIRYKLSKNLNLQDPRSITNSFLNQLIPTLAELSTYICARTSSSCVSKPQYFPSEQTKSFSDKNDISSINAELETLKNLLELFTTTFTPNNVGFYLKPKLYKDMDKTKTKMVFAELTRLTKMEKFNVDDTTNAPRQRAISFLNQLKNILRKANRKY